MANYVMNYLKFKNEKDFETARSYIKPNGEINADILVPMTNKMRDVVKEIMDGTADWDNEDLKYYFEHYNIFDFWKKIYWGATYLHNTKVGIDEKIIIFDTNWTPAIGVVKALHDLKLDFIYLYKNEGYDEYDYVEFKSQTEVHDGVLPNASMITDDDFLKNTYLEFMRIYGGDEVRRMVRN